MRTIAFVGVLGTLGLAIALIFSGAIQNGLEGEGSHQTFHSSTVEKSDWQKLGSTYRIAYGDQQAPVHMTEYFSFQCPHCIALFRSDFERIKRELIDTGNIYFEFHPVPQDLPTAQAMICFESLSEKEKRLFLEVVFEEATPTDPDFMTALMKAAMNVFEKPTPYLDDTDFLKNHPVFEEIFRFIKQEAILAVPTVEVNGRLYMAEIPDYGFIHSFVEAS